MSDALALGTSLDLTGLTKGFDDAARMVDGFAADTMGRTENLKIAAPSFAAGGEGPDPGAIVAGLGGVANSIVARIDGLANSLAAKIGTALTAALAPIDGLANKFSGQFDKVEQAAGRIGGVLSKALDFPKLFKSDYFAKEFGPDGAAFGPIQTFAQRAESQLSGIFGSAGPGKIAGWVDEIEKAGRATAKIKAPRLSFEGAAKMATAVGSSLAGASRHALAVGSSLAGASRQVATLGGATDKATSSFKAMGLQVAASLGAFGLTYKAVGFLKTGIQSAVDLNETLSATDAILGNASPAVKAFADGLSSQFGLIKGDVLEAASSFGGLGKGLGQLQGADLSSFTNQFTQAAADLSSFKNVSLAEAGRALTIGLSGEQSDLLKRIGVTTTEAAMSQYALAHGIRKTGKEWSEQEKFAIRSGLILEKLGGQGINALGDLDRTAGGAANQQRKLGGTIANLGTSIGQALLPALHRGIAMLSGFAGAASDAFERNRPMIEAFAAKVGYGFDVIASAAASFAPVVLGIGTAIAGAFAAGGAGALDFLPDIGAVVDGVKGGLLSVQFFVTDVAASLGNLFGGDTTSAIGNFAGMVGTWVVGAFDALGYAVRNAGDLIQIGFIKAWSYGRWFVDNLAEIPENFGRIAKFIGENWVELVLSSLSIVGEGVRSLASGIWESMKDPFGGNHFDFSGVLRDFESLKNTLADAPALKIKAPDISPELDRLNESIAKREADFAAKMGPKFVLPEMAKAPTSGMTEGKALANALPDGMGDKDKKGRGNELKFAGAARLGTNEAYEAIIRATSGRGGPNDAAIRLTKDTLAENKKQTGLLADIRDGFKSSTGAGMAVLNF